MKCECELNLTCDSGESQFEIHMISVNLAPIFGKKMVVSCLEGPLATFKTSM